MISDRMYKAVETGARLVATDWQKIEWEDLRQEMFVWLLERPNQIQFLEGKDDNREVGRIVRKVIRQLASEMHTEEMLARGQNHYSTNYVRAMLKGGFLQDARKGTLSEHWDLTSGMAKMQENNPESHKIILEKYVEGLPFTTQNDWKRVQRAVDTLVDTMNQNWIREVAVYDGPRSRNYGLPVEDSMDHEHYYENIN